MNSNICRIDENTFDYYGYRVSKSGEIYRKDRITGEWCELKSYHFTYPGSHITMWIDGKQKKIMKAKLIYELFSGEELNRGVVLQFRDDDRNNCAYENMYTITRKEFAHKRADYNKKKIDDDVCAELVNIYEQRDGHSSGTSLRKLSQMYGCSLKVIQKALHSKG